MVTNVVITLLGENCLMMHAQGGLNRRDPLAKDFSILNKKRGKKDEDYLAMSDMEFELGLYHKDDIGPYIPAFNVHRCIKDGAKMLKKGRDIDRALRPLEDEFALAYDGPRDVKSLKADHKFRDCRIVRVGQAMVERTRPIFRGWGLKAYFTLDLEMLDINELAASVKQAGEYVGLGEFRPGSPKNGGQMGRFGATVEELKNGYTKRGSKLAGVGQDR